MVHLADVADVELNQDGTIIARDSWDGSVRGSEDSGFGMGSLASAPASADSPPASPGRHFNDHVTRTDSGVSVDLNGAAPVASARTLRDFAKNAVKKLETDIIKDQKRIKFVDEIYDASSRPEDDDGTPFVSPLRRRHEASGKNIAALRAARESLERGTAGVKFHLPTHEPRSSDAGGDDHELETDPTKSRLKSEPGFFPPVEELSLTDIVGQESEDTEKNQTAKSVDKKKRANAYANASAIPKSGVHDEVEDVWLEVFRLLRLRTWIFLDDPDSSPLAYFTSMTILALIVTSSVTFCLETMSEFKQPQHTAAFWVIECVCIAAFTAEYLFKLLCCPNVRKFVVQPLNLVDLISILPFFIELIISSTDGGSTRIFRTVRLVRVFRVIKLGSRSGKLQVVTRTMHESLDMLAMMFFLLALTVLVFATLVYFAEKGDYFPTEDLYARDVDVVCVGSVLASANSGSLTQLDGTLIDGCSRVPSPYKSIPDSFWWTMVTLMTVGYGDEVPVTGAGRLVACLAMLASVLLMALPISVIGSEFTQQWTEYMKHIGEMSGRGRKAAPRFLEVTQQLKTHTQIVDEIMRKMRDVQTDIDERTLRVKQIVRARDKETQTSRRKALARGKHAPVSVAALVGEKKEGAPSASERLLAREVEELLNERETLRKTAQTAELMVSANFPTCVSNCLDKCLFMNELATDDYDMIVADIDDLMYRALEWYKERGLGRKILRVKRDERDGLDQRGSPGPHTPKTPGRIEAQTPPESVGPRL